jgi:hypothetical protein
VLQSIVDRVCEAFDHRLQVENDMPRNSRGKKAAAG